MGRERADGADLEASELTTKRCTDRCCSWRVVGLLVSFARVGKTSISRVSRSQQLERPRIARELGRGDGAARDAGAAVALHEGLPAALRHCDDRRASAT